MKTDHPPPRPRRGAGPHKGAESLTLAERADARKAELEAARIEASRNPDDEEAQDRYAKAKRAFAAHMSVDDLETRAIVALDLIASGATTAQITTAITEQFGINRASAYRVLEEAVSSLPSMAVEAYRVLTVTRLEQLASEARGAADFASATRATIAAAKLAGVSEKTETSITVRRDDPDVVPAEVRRRLEDPRTATFFLMHDRLPEPGELAAFVPPHPADIMRGIPLLPEKT
jgi:hypothetical protein